MTPKEKEEHLKLLKDRREQVKTSLEKLDEDIAWLTADVNATANAGPSGGKTRKPRLIESEEDAPKEEAKPKKAAAEKPAKAAKSKKPKQKVKMAVPDDEEPDTEPSSEDEAPAKSPEPEEEPDTEPSSSDDDGDE